MSVVQPAASDVKAFAEEFADTPDIRIELMFEYADNFVHPEKWAKKFKMAKILMTCHLMKMNSAEKNGSAGIVQSESLGDQSISMAVPDSNEMLNLSVYGQQFLALRKTLGITPIVL